MYNMFPIINHIKNIENEDLDKKRSIIIYNRTLKN